MDEVKRIAKALGLKVGKCLGSGIHMAQQPWTQAPGPGDYCWDGDWGYIMYTGERWHPIEIATNPRIQKVDSKQYPMVAGQTNTQL